MYSIATVVTCIHVAVTLAMQQHDMKLQILISVKCHVLNCVSTNAWSNPLILFIFDNPICTADVLCDDASYTSGSREVDLNHTVKSAVKGKS